MAIIYLIFTTIRAILLWFKSEYSNKFEGLTFILQTIFATLFMNIMLDIISFINNNINGIQEITLGEVFAQNRIALIVLLFIALYSRLFIKKGVT